MRCNIRSLRRYRWVFIGVMFLFVCSCNTEISKSETVVRDGLVFQKGAAKPFTGSVVGKGYSEGYRLQTTRYKKQYKKGVLDGKSYFWYLSGKIESVEPYENGTLHGNVIRYYENGQIKARIHFKNGERGGLKGEMFWDENGKKRRG